MEGIGSGTGDGCGGALDGPKRNRPLRSQRSAFWQWRCGRGSSARPGPIRCGRGDPAPREAGWLTDQRADTDKYALRVPEFPPRAEKSLNLLSVNGLISKSRPWRRSPRGISSTRSSTDRQLRDQMRSRTATNGSPPLPWHRSPPAAAATMRAPRSNPRAGAVVSSHERPDGHTRE